MKIAVKDANILIDLANGGLVEAVLRLPYDFVTTDAVLLQLENETQWEQVRPYVEQGVIQTMHLSGEEMQKVADDPLRDRLGIADLEVLTLAAREKGILLTGDLDLRKEAKTRQVTVHGLIWLLDRLLEKELLERAEAAKKLRLMMALGARLPADEVARRLRDWAK